VRVKYQLREQLNSYSWTPLKNLVGKDHIKGIASEIRRSLNLIIIYSLSTAASAAASYQFLGQAFQGLHLINSHRHSWLYAMLFGILVYVAETIISTYFFPKIKSINALAAKITFIFAASSLITGALLLSAVPALTRTLLLASYAIVSLVSAGALQRYIQSQLQSVVKAEYRATWLSTARCSGLLSFGLLSGGFILFDLTALSTSLFCILSAGLAFYFGIKLTLTMHSSEKIKSSRPFRKVLVQFITIIASACAFTVYVFDLSTFVRSTSLAQSRKESAIAHLVETAIKEPLTQGSFLEASRRLQRMMSDGVFHCSKIKAWNFEQDFCQTRGTESLSSILVVNVGLDNKSGATIGTVTLIFDRSEIWIDALARSIQVFIVLVICAATLYLALKQLANKTVSELDTVVALATSENPVEPALLESIEIAEFRAISELLQKAWKEREASNRQLAVAAIAQQVAHDIRSPLAALTVAEQDLSALPEETRLMIRSAITRIKDIANGLLQQNSTQIQQDEQTTKESEILSIQLLPAVIDGLVTEKRTQYRSRLGIKIEYNVGYRDYGIFSRIQPNEFKRILSNLINNSVEALGDTGRIEMTMKGSPSEVTLVISDNGQGIPPEILPKLMQRGETHGKAGGSGLGLYHARSQLEAWGGRLEIRSTVGHGTAVTIRLPRASEPHWFLPALKLKPQSLIVVVDDDESIHQIWQGRIDKLKPEFSNIDVNHFSTAQEIEDWVASKYDPKLNTVFLFDYELLGQNTHGLALIEKLHLAQQSILVTSRFEDQTIRDSCQRLGVKLIPKGMAGFISIELMPVVDAILIDDDDLVHLSWNFAAKKASCKLLGFKTAEEFLKNASTFDTEIPIFIDSNLGTDGNGNSVRGEEVSRQLHQMGFKRLYLATGDTHDSSRSMPWLVAVRGKEPPFGEAGFTFKR
jgi:signal transduction histidine kinase/FixJ family two-component response regulator